MSKLALAVLLTASACVAAARRPAARYTGWAPDRPAVVAADVQVISSLAPYGISRDQGGAPTVPAGYPTPSDPHAVLGIASIPGEVDRVPVERARQLAIEEAARHGGNALYSATHNGSPVHYVLYLSRAEPVFPPASAGLDGLERAYGKGDYKRYGGDAARTLDEFARVELPARAMTCFRAAVSLDARARLAGDLGIQMAVHVEGRRSRTYSVPIASPLVRTRSFLVQLGCYANSQGVTWRLTRADGGPGALGTGKVLVRTFALTTDASMRRRHCAALEATERQTAIDEDMCTP